MKYLKVTIDKENNYFENVEDILYRLSESFTPLSSVSDDLSVFLVEVDSDVANFILEMDNFGMLHAEEVYFFQR